jgi:hypothetical protein
MHFKEGTLWDNSWTGEYNSVSDVNRSYSKNSDIYSKIKSLRPVLYVEFRSRRMQFKQ